MREIGNWFRRDLTEGNYRKRHISHIIQFALDNNFVEMSHVSGTVVDLGANIGPGLAAYRKYGGRLIAVDRTDSTLRRGAAVGLIHPQIDYMVAKDMMTFLCDFSVNSPVKASLISFFGLSKLYFQHTEEFAALAYNSLTPDGALLMTGVPGDSTLKLFTTFSDILGGGIFEAGIHPYDRYGYYMRKKESVYHNSLYGDTVSRVE